MTKAFPALASVPLLTARGLLSLAVGAHAWAQNSPPAATPNPTIFQLQHTAWTERDGAPPAINDISQAPDGSLWLGSGEGLYRFDGFAFERVRAIDGDSPAPTEVYALLATSNGDLWIGTSYNGAILLRDGVAKHLPNFEGIPPNTTMLGFAKDLDGTIWAATASGLQRFDGSQWRSVGKAWGLPEMVRFWFVQPDSNGTLWTEASEHGLFKLKRGSRHFDRLVDLSRQNILFDRSPSGEYWASTSSGICPLAEVLNGTAGPHCVVHVNPSATQLVPAYPGLVFDRRGNLWTRSVGGEGIRWLDAAAFRDAFHPGHREANVASFTRRDGLTSGNVRSLFQDRRDGSIWVGTDHGLDHFRESPFLPALSAPGAQDFGVRPHDGGAWISSYRGGLWFNSPDGTTRKISGPVRGSNIGSLYEARRGSLWIGTELPVRIESLDDGKTTSLPLTPELEAQVGVQSIMEDGRGALWVSFVPYGLAKWESGHWVRNGGLTGLPEAWVVILNTDPDGKLWAGYLNGEAAVIDGTSVRRFSAKDGLNIGPVAAILSARSDCWLAGVNGLVHFDGRRFQVLLDAYRPFSGITGIAQAKNGDLWLNAWDGVRHIAAGELERAEKNPAYAVHSDLYDLTDGLPSVPVRIRPFPTAVSAADGRIWFGLQSGVVSVDPGDPGLSTSAPPVSIVRAIADGKTFHASPNAKLAARTKNLEIDYTAVSLNRAGRVRFRYKLEGVDAGWQNAGSRRQAFYNNLQPGRHRFVVSASNGDNLWNEAGATINLEVPPAFDQTIWFRSLCVLAAMLGLWCILRLRIRQTVAKVQAQSRERMRERERIARELHDTMLQRFQGSILLFEAARYLLSTNPAKAAQTLDGAIDQAVQSVAEGRDAIQGLRSSTVETNELARVIDTLGKELGSAGSNQDSGSSPKLTVEVEGEARELHPILRDEIHRIAGETLRNAFRHAQAERIDVAIRYGDRQLRLRIRDDGKGMSQKVLKEGVSGHFGLPGMRERAESIGARLTVWSEPDAGTEIELNIPAAIAYTKPRRFRFFAKRAGTAS